MWTQALAYGARRGLSGTLNRRPVREAHGLLAFVIMQTGPKIDSETSQASPHDSNHPQVLIFLLLLLLNLMVIDGCGRTQLDGTI